MPRKIDETPDVQPEPVPAAPEPPVDPDYSASLQRLLDSQIVLSMDGGAPAFREGHLAHLRWELGTDAESAELRYIDDLRVARKHGLL